MTKIFSTSNNDAQKSNSTNIVIADGHVVINNTENLSNPSSKRCSFLTRLIGENLLLALTILAVILGFSIGFGLRTVELSEEVVQLINFPGEIFLQVLKMMILPLIFSSLISALAQLDIKAAGQMGLRTIAYYSVTTTLAIITGISLVLLIHPGDPSVKTVTQDTEPHTPVSPLDTFLDVIRNMFPENVVQATFQRVQTNYYIEKPPLWNTTDQNLNEVIKKKIEHVDGMNILGIIVFCTAFGIVVSKLGENAKNVVDFFVVLETIIMKLIETFMWLAPIGITSLICGSVLELTDLNGTLAVLGKYLVTILCGLAIHTFITMPVLFFAVTRRNPLIVVKGMTQSLVTTFGTASGGASLPISMRCMEDLVKVDRRVTRFVLPLGATINMDGNALYEAVAVVFIAQLNGIELSFAEVITVSLIATLASLGLNSVPAGLVSILLILNTVNLPSKDVSLLITIDWLIDRIRTTINVLGDAYAATAIAHTLKDQLKEVDETDEYKNEIREEIEILQSIVNSPGPSRRSSVQHGNYNYLHNLRSSLLSSSSNPSKPKTKRSLSTDLSCVQQKNGRTFSEIKHV